MLRLRPARLRATLLAAAIVVPAFFALGCGNECNPDFGPASVPNGVQEQANGDYAVVVKWESIPGTALPDAYYADMTIDEPTGEGSSVLSADVVDGNTIQLTFPADPSPAHLVFQFSLGDPADYTSQCSHPGSGDSYTAELTLNAADKDSTASLAITSSDLGACAAAPDGVARGPYGLAVVVAAALVASLMRRARRRRGAGAGKA